MAIVVLYYNNDFTITAQFYNPLLINHIYVDSISWSNTTFVDSGGFQIIAKGLKISREEILKRYRKLAEQSDRVYFFNYDYPSIFAKVKKENFDNFEFFYTKFEQAEKIIPIIHIYTRKDIDFAIDFYKQYTNYLALGGLIPSSRLKLFKNFLPFYVYVRRKVNWLHVLGLPSIKRSYFFRDATQYDTSTFIHDSLFRKVYLPDGDVVSIRSKEFEDRKEELFRFLDITRFPFSYDVEEYHNLARINIWVVLKSDRIKPTNEVQYFEHLKRLGEDSLIQEMKAKFIEARRKIAEKILNNKLPKNVVLDPTDYI